MAEMLVKIEQRINAILAEVAHNICIRFQQIAITGACFPAFHRVALHHAVGVFPADTFLRQRQQQLL